MKKVIPKFSRDFACRKYEQNTGEAVDREENRYNDVKTVRGFIYPDDRVNTSGACEDAVTDRTTCG